MTLKNFFFLSFACLLLQTEIAAQAGDTTYVQTYTFEEQNNPETAYDSPGRRTFTFPEDDGTEYQKILMYYKLKCFEDGTAGGLGFDCGEWDYLSYTYLFDYTGLLDSNLVAHPTYLFDNQNQESFQYGELGYSNTQMVEQSLLVIDDIISEDVYELGGNGLGGHQTWATAASTGRSQYLYTATELMAAGLEAGPIHRLGIYVNGQANDLDFLTVKMANFEGEELTNPVQLDAGYYYSAHTSTEIGWVELNLLQPFIWDGNSSIVLDMNFSNENGSENILVNAHDSGFNSGLAFQGDDKYLELEWYDEIKIPAEAFDDLDDEVTISFWHNGDVDAQPLNSTIFEGLNENNQRVLNSHLPWSNSRIYWDAGQDGGYDRIDKAATTSEIEGVWTHWAFTKNTNSGEMKIFKNGALWHSGTNFDNSMAGIVKFSIGGDPNGSRFHEGSMDEFQIFKAELNEETISDWLYRDYNGTHPNAADILVYYPFNGENGELVEDLSGNGHHGVPYGSPNRLKYRGDEIFRAYSTTSLRPQARFYSGEYMSHLETQEVSYETPVPQASLVEYDFEGNYVIQTEIDYYWPDGYAYIYGTDGIPLDSVLISGGLSNDNVEFEYYQPPFEVVDRYEIGRFITPYGIGLDLDDGWTWVYDVTDFEPLLHGEVELEAGNWQELLDLKFAFIEGTPAREVKRVERLWGGSFNLSTIEETIVGQEINVQEDEEMFRLKATTTGHQFSNNTNCAEFCHKTQSVDVDGTTHYSWEIMQECADNPLYPQGGTWIFDRAGWCPGMPGETHDLELTPFISGDSFVVDYDSETDPFGNYIFEGYLISYGAPNHSIDVEIEDILAPSDMKIKSRFNPMCDNPIVKIRNLGSETLTSCTITYGVNGQMETFNWTGNLEFLESEEVELVYSNDALWDGDEDELLTFQAEVSNPNGTVDENEFNNVATSNFYRPPVHQYSDLDDNRIIFWVTTNNAYWETSYTLYDMDGNVVYEKDDFDTGNTAYRDTVEINEGCYMFHLKDSGDDGLSFFANNDGSGTARLKKVSSGSLITFENDFGKDIKYYFVWKTNVVSVEEERELKDLNVFPNPSSGMFHIDFGDLHRNSTIAVYDAKGRMVHREENIRMERGMLYPLDMSEFSDGLYTIRVNKEGLMRSARIIKE